MILAIRSEHSGVTISQSLVMGMWRLFHGPIHNSSSSDCVLSLGHSSGSLMTSPSSSSSLSPSTFDSLSPSFNSSLSTVLWGCPEPPCAAFSRFDLDATLSVPVLLVLVDPNETLDCRVLNTFSVLLLSVLEKEEVAVAEAAIPELWKVRSVLHPTSVLGLFRGTLSSSVAAILSSFLKCLASRELKTGELSLRLLFVLVCVCAGPVVFTERRVRMMEPFWAT